jgi:predicted nucleic acid-binding protein
VLLSEDMQHGQVFNNQLKVVNPFIWIRSLFAEYLGKNL